MAGIIFFETAALDRMVDFYTERLDASVWLEQAGCTILRHENLLIGFCGGDRAETDGTITLFTTIGPPSTGCTTVSTIERTGAPK